MSFWRVGGCYRNHSQLVPGGIQCLSVPRLPLLSVGTRTLLCHHHGAHRSANARSGAIHPEKLTASATTHHYLEQPLPLCEHMAQEFKH